MKRRGMTLSAVLMASALTVGTFTTSSLAASRAANPLVITMQLPANSGYESSAQNEALVALVKKYETKHLNVSIKLLPDDQNSPPAQTSWLTTVAAGQSAPDIVDEFYQLVNAGAVPNGILQNLKPYLMKPDPYLGGKPWISSWYPVFRGAMTDPSGAMYILVGATNSISIYYNKAQFTKAGIASPPKTYKDWVQDMGKLKKAGFTPLLFGTNNGNVEPSWWERKVQTQLLQSFVPEMDVNHSKALSGLDLVVGVKEGIISMKNPAYAEVWKLLGALTPYMAPDQSEYSSVAPVTSMSPPLSVLPGFAQGKYSMVFGTSSQIETLNQLGMKGKFGVFPLPRITRETTPFAPTAASSASALDNSPNSAPEYAVTTPAANKSMTPEKLKQIIDFLQFLYAPANEGPIVADETYQSSPPTIIGAKKILLPGINGKAPKKFPVVVDGVLNDGLTPAAEVEGSRIIQEYIGGSISFNQFSTQWDSLLQTAADAWVQSHKVDIGPYLKKKQH